MLLPDADVPYVVSAVEPETDVPAVPTEAVPIVSTPGELLVVRVELVDVQPAKNMKLAIRIASFCIDLLVRYGGAHSPKLPRFGAPRIFRRVSQSPLDQPRRN